MADKTINELTAATTMGNDDLLVLQQGGVAKKLSGKQLGDYVYNAAAEKVTEVNQAVDDAKESINDIVESVQSMTELGTDTTLTTSGMAADAKAAGDKIKKVEAAAMADLSQGTASGSIVTITDGADSMPIKKMTVDIEPVQEGTGDPSPDNIRPISGWTEANITRVTNNLFDKAHPNKINAYFDNSKIYSNSGQRIVYIPCKPNTTYTASKIAVNSGTSDRFGFAYTKQKPVDNVAVYGSHWKGSGFISGQKYSFSVTTDEEAKYLVVYISREEEYDASLNTLMIEIGETASNYEAYNGTTYPITFPSEAGTVYGGKLEINEDGSGVLTVDRVVWNGEDLQWSKSSASNYRSFIGVPLNPIRYSNSTTTVWSSVYRGTNNNDAKSEEDLYVWANALTPTNRIAVKDTAKASMTAEEFKTAMTGVQFLCKLQASYIYTFTAPQVATLLGTNNIWADTGDITEFVYRKAPIDSSDIDEKIAKIEPIIAGRETAMTATKNYPSRGLVIVDHTLYKLDTNVASGETLTPGVNCHMTTVEAEIAERVPNYRTVNGNDLSFDITLSAEDIPYDNSLSEHTSGSVGEVVSGLKSAITKSFPAETSTGYTNFITASAMPVKSITIDSSATKLFRTGKNLSGGDAWLTVGGTINLTERTVSGTNSSNLPQIAAVEPKEFKEKTVYTIILTGKTTATHDSCGLEINYTDGTRTELTGFGADKATIKRTTNPNKTFAGVSRISNSGRKYFYVDECGIFEGNISVEEFEAYQGEIYTVTDGVTNKEVTTLQGFNAIWAYPKSESTVEYCASISQKWISDKFATVDQEINAINFPDVVKLHEKDKAKAEVFKIQRTSGENYGNAALAMIFFTDVHNDMTRLKRFVDLANAWGNSYINLAINGGDTTATIYDVTQLSAYDTEISNCTIPVLNTVGNHDAYSTLTGARPLEAQTTIYNAITAKVAENVPSIVQPTDASTNGLNYYYYDKGSIRVIVLDCMYWDADELTWFESVLADAATNQKAVIAVSHYNFESTVAEYVDSIWNPKSYGVGGISSYAMPITAAQAVKTFQDNGGEFIIWLCGHSHGDAIKKLKSEYGIQFQLICPSFVNRAGTVFKASDLNAYNYDCLTYLVVDTHYKIIRGLRIGANINNEGAEYHGFAINYGTGTLAASY